MEDKVFGSLSFRFGWIKNETITIWNQSFRVRIRTSRRKDEKPTQTQQNAYLDFKSNLDTICSSVKDRVEKYIYSYQTDIQEQLGVSKIENPFSLLIAKEVLFFQNGKYAILFDTKWSENGMAILCDKNHITVGDSDIVEFEM